MIKTSYLSLCKLNGYKSRLLKYSPSSTCNSLNFGRCNLLSSSRWTGNNKLNNGHHSIPIGTLSLIQSKCFSSSTIQKLESKENNEKESLFSIFKSTVPSQKELIQMFLTILALMGGTMFILSDFFLNILVRKSMKLLGWDKLFDYESITGCFLCGSMQVHNLKIKKLDLSQNQSLNGNISDLYIVIPWYLVAKEALLKRWNEKSQSFLALPRFVVIGGDLNCTSEGNVQSVADALGFDSVIVEGMGFFDLKIHGDKYCIDIDRLEIFDSFSFERNVSNFQSLALYSNGKFKFNNVNIKTNIHHDDNTKTFDRSKDGESVSYYNWVQDNAEYLSTQWIFEDSTSTHNPVAILCKKHTQHNFIQIQTHLQNNPTPHSTLNVPLEKFQQAQVINHCLTQYLPSLKI